MANFKTHITTSTVLGVGYGAAGVWLLREPSGEVPIATCLLGAGLCSISGILPDLDSDSSIPLRETVAFSAAVVPMLMIHRFAHLGLDHEQMVLVGVALYLAIRFGFFALLRRYTVHRGMFHSIPAALIAAELGFLLCSCETMAPRYYKAGAVLFGYMIHLTLDELYAIEWRRGRWRLKKSFGTALKFWGTSSFANASTYAKLAVLALIAFQDPVWMERIEDKLHQGRQLPRTAVETIENIWR